MRTTTAFKARLWRRLVRAAGVVASFLALVVLSGATLQAFIESSERERYPPPGELVDIGDGQKIHLRRWGTTNPGPTIVLDGSATVPSSIWAWIGRDLGQRHNVVAYDRPGMGWSRGPGTTRDARSAAEALAAALSNAGIPPPYVVVGHSYGGFSARVFAATYGSDVAGLVLLDTTHPDGGGGPGFAALYRLRAWQGHTGLFQLIPPVDDFWELPVDEGPAARAVSLWTSHLDASAEELEAWEASAAQVRAVDLADLPLLVVSGVGSAQQVEMQRELTRLSAASTFVELNVSHMGMLMNRDQAATVTATIERFISSITPAFWPGPVDPRLGHSLSC